MIKLYTESLTVTSIQGNKIKALYSRADLKGYDMIVDTDKLRVEVKAVYDELIADQPTGANVDYILHSLSGVIASIDRVEQLAKICK